MRNPALRRRQGGTEFRREQLPEPVPAATIFSGFPEKLLLKSESRL